MVSTFSAEPHGQGGHALGMAGGGGIARLDRRHRRVHERVEQVLDVLDEAGVLEGDRGLAGQRGHELLVHRGEGDDHLLDELDGLQDDLGVALLVDELDDADDGVLVVAHRHHQHRLRPIAGLLVEGAGDLERRSDGQVVGVGDVHDLAGEGRIARDRVLGEREGKLLERAHGNGIVLGQLEPELVVGVRLRILASLDEVEASPSAAVISRHFKRISSSSLSMSRWAERATRCG
jgi:hypothetical protein